MREAKSRFWDGTKNESNGTKNVPRTLMEPRMRQLVLFTANPHSGPICHSEFAYLSIEDLPCDLCHVTDKHVSPCHVIGCDITWPLITVKAYRRCYCRSPAILSVLLLINAVCLNIIIVDNPNHCAFSIFSLMKNAMTVYDSIILYSYTVPLNCITLNNLNQLNESIHR